MKRIAVPLTLLAAALGCALLAAAAQAQNRTYTAVSATGTVGLPGTGPWHRPVALPDAAGRLQRDGRKRRDRCARSGPVRHGEHYARGHHPRSRLGFGDAGNDRCNAITITAARLARSLYKGW